MLQLIAAIPTVISAAKKVSGIFRKGKEVVEQITGQPSQASNPDELQSELQELSPDHQNRWAEIMAKEVEMYAAQNERLALEMGLVDTSITKKLTTETADKISILRMTTRPWTVRWMVRFVLFPFLLAAIDIVQNLLITWFPFLTTKLKITPFATFEHFFGLVQLPEGADEGILKQFVQLFTEGGGTTTFAGQLYVESVPWVVSIILGYMTLREVGKWKGSADEMPPSLPAGGQPARLSVVGKTLKEGMNLAGKVADYIRKKRAGG